MDLTEINQQLWFLLDILHHDFMQQEPLVGGEGGGCECLVSLVNFHM